MRRNETGKLINPLHSSAPSPVYAPRSFILSYYSSIVNILPREAGVGAAVAVINLPSLLSSGGVSQPSLNLCDVMRRRQHDDELLTYLNAVTALVLDRNQQMIITGPTKLTVLTDNLTRLFDAIADSNV